MIDTLVPLLATTLLHSLWQGAAIVCVAGVALIVVPRGRARLRHAILGVALGAHLAAPLATFFVLQRNSAIRGIVAPGEVNRTAASPALAASARARAGSRTSAMTAPLPAPPRMLAVLQRLAPIAVALWLAGVLVGAVRFAGGWFVLRRVIRASVPANREVALRVRLLADRLQIRRAIGVCISRTAAVPFTSSWIRPVIVLPVSMFAGLHPAFLDAIIAHELAHVRRWDYLLGLMQSLATTLLFHHPATWWLDRQLRIEREYCADDGAVAITRDRVTYVRALAELEERRLGLPLALAASDRSLVARVERLLAPPRPSYSAGMASVIAAAALLLTAVSVRAMERTRYQAPSPAAARLVAVAREEGTVGVHNIDPTSRGQMSPSQPNSADKAGAQAASLSSRWARALAAGKARQDDMVIGWYIRSAITDGGDVVSSTDGSSHTPGPSVVEAAGLPASTRGVAILISVDAMGTLREVRLRSLHAAVALHDGSLEWLGASGDVESLALLEQLSATAEPHLRSELGAALSLHDDSPRVLAAVSRVMVRDRDDGVRGETIAWLGRHAVDPAAVALVRRAIDDESAHVRDEALTVLMANNTGNPSLWREILRTSRYDDVRDEIAEHLARERRSGWSRGGGRR